MGAIVVMGAGVMGLSMAWELARRGAPVRVIEAQRPGAGASGGLVGALAPHTPDGWNTGKVLQFEALRMAPGFWSAVTAAGGVDPGYARLGRVQPLADAKALARARAREADAHKNWPGFHWRVVPADAVPGLRLSCDWVVHDDLTARLSPRAAVAALVAALAARGVTVETGISPPVGPEAVIWATGAAGLQAAGLGAAQKGQAALLQGDWRDAPQLSAPGLHVVPHADGTVAIGSTSERDFAEPEETDGQLDAVIARARELCPDLAKAPVVARWAGLRPRPASRQPVVGPLTGDVYILNGGFKTGFAMAPLMARMLADLLLDGTDRIPAAWRPPQQA